MHANSHLKTTMCLNMIKGKEDISECNKFFLLKSEVKSKLWLI